MLCLCLRTQRRRAASPTDNASAVHQPETQKDKELAARSARTTTSTAYQRPHSACSDDVCSDSHVPEGYSAVRSSGYETINDRLSDDDSDDDEQMSKKPAAPLHNKAHNSLPDLYGVSNDSDGEDNNNINGALPARTTATNNPHLTRLARQDSNDSNDSGASDDHPDPPAYSKVVRPSKLVKLVTNEASSPPTPSTVAASPPPPALPQRLYTLSDSLAMRVGCGTPNSSARDTFAESETSSINSDSDFYQMLASLAGTSANSTRASSIEQLPSQTFNSQPLPPSGLRTSSSPKTNSEPPNPANVGIKPPTSAAAATLALLQDVESKMNSADSEDGGPDRESPGPGLSRNRRSLYRAIADSPRGSAENTQRRSFKFNRSELTTVVAAQHDSVV